MSKKRTADDDETTSEAGLHHEDNVKRAKLDPLTDKTLQDLPIRLLERILIKAVVMEVRSMRLAKSVWTEKADLVISRLTTVCVLWSSILNTYRFQTEVHRILDDTAQWTIRLEVLHQSRFDHAVDRFTRLNEEIFLILITGVQSPAHVDVYDFNDLAVVKDVIALPAGKSPLGMEACSESNCVYVLCQDLESNGLYRLVLRIKKNGEHRFNISPWISDINLVASSISVFPNGILSLALGCDPVALRHYDTNGTLVLYASVHGLGFVDRVMQKANGNLVLASQSGDKNRRVLTEIDADGKAVRQHVSSLDGDMSTVVYAYGRDIMLITDPIDGCELLDSEFNSLDFEGRQLTENMHIDFSEYNGERNEFVSIGFCVSDLGDLDPTFTTFRFTEE